VVVSELHHGGLMSTSEKSEVEREFEKGDAVFFKCSNPATGFIKRVGKDKTWAIVEWSYGLDCRSATKQKLEHLVHLTPVLNQHLGVPFLDESGNTK
jgi:hypothetical protein